MKLFSATPFEHVASLGLILAAMALLRVPFIATLVFSFLTQISPCPENPSNGGTENGCCGTEKTPTTPIQYEPLGVANWIIHFFIVSVGLEISASLWRAPPSTKKNALHGDPRKTKESVSRTKALGIMFLLFWIQGAFTVLEHSLLGGVNPRLAEKLNEVGFRALMHFNVFLLPFVVQSPRRGWLVAPLMAYLTLTDRVSFFHGYAGRILGTASMAAILFGAPEFHVAFKMGYVGVGVLPLLSEKVKAWLGLEDGSDQAHLIMASLVAVSSVAMALGLRLNTEHQFHIRFAAHHQP